jgi:EAL domain-containing protein (putative c-di-GMP-specific phosphodiesterase class I)
MGLKPVKTSINFSKKNVRRPDFIIDLMNILSRYQIESKYIEIELTETAEMFDDHNLVSFVDVMHENDINVSIDDFGTGYSSLNMLAELPVDVLKLDMRFVQNLHSNEKQEKMLGLVIDIAQFMSMQIVAEGVENEDQLNMLRSLGCVTIQGYYFSKPLALDDFIKLAEESRVNKNAD